MNIGFTGTRKGMSNAQRVQLRWLLALFKHADQAVDRTTVLHHGGAEGADSEACHYASVYGCEECLHDPYSMTAKYLLERNRNIVKSCDVLIAAPAGDKEEQRSGTWATIRYARKAGKPVIMLSRGAK